jgi:hypothetical protein
MFNSLLRFVSAGALLAGFCAAGPVTLNFTGSITAGSQDLSKFELLYYGSDGTDEIRGFQPVFNAGTSNRFCAANATCSIEATITGFVASDTWAPTTASAYTIVGWYGAGPTIVGFTVIDNPSVFVLTKSGIDFAGGDFVSAFGIDENRFSTHMISWSDVTAFPDGTGFVANNAAYLPGITLGGAGSAGSLWDFSNGVQNGSASIQGAIAGAAVPEPATTFLFLGGIAAIAVRRRVMRARRAI